MRSSDWLMLGSFVVAFAALEYFTVRSARKTKVLEDPMMRGSLLGVAAQNSMVVRVIAGTIGALAGSILFAVIATLIAEKVLGWR